MNQLLTVRNLRTYFMMSGGVLKAVDGVSLAVSSDEVVGLIGESGCGKTATAFSVMRLVSPPGKIVSGEIIFEDKDLLKLGIDEMRKIRGKRISMVFQDPMTYLNPLMKVGNQITEIIKLHEQADNKQASAKAIEVLEKVQIPSAGKVVDYYPHQLSGGMRQRVLIAMAIVSNPSLLILDEPTTALDVSIQAQILDLIKVLGSKYVSSVLLITHDLGVVAEICDRVYVMYAGKIVEEADVYDLFRSPKHPYTQGLINSILTITERKTKIPTIEGSVPDPLNYPSGCRYHPRCPKAMQVCREKEPPLFYPNSKNPVACWLYNDN